jgi:putative transposase
VFSRRIVGWQLAPHLRTSLALDALEMAIWTRRRDPDSDLSVLVHHSAQYLSIRYSDRSPTKVPSPASAAAVTPTTTRSPRPSSVCSRPSSFRRRGPWRGLDDLEIATLEWVDWWNHRRLHAALGHVPPAEHETQHHQQTAPAAP